MLETVYTKKTLLNIMITIEDRSGELKSFSSRDTATVVRKYFERNPVLKKEKSPRRLLLFILLIIICLLLLGSFVAIRYNDKKTFFLNASNKTESFVDRYYLTVEEIQQEVEKEQTSHENTLSKLLKDHWIRHVRRKRKSLLKVLYMSDCTILNLVQHILLKT